MTDIVIEIIRAAVSCLILFYLVAIGKRERIQEHKGWLFIVAGFALISFGMIVDITDNFDSLNRFVVIGDTEYQAILEKIVGFLFGFILLALGFWKWIPTVVTLKEAQKALQDEKTFSDTVINAIPGLLAVYEDGVRLIMVNEEEHFKKTGYHADEIYDRHPTDWFYEEDIPKVIEALEQVNTKGDVQVDLDLKIKDGSKIPYQFVGRFF